MVTVRVPATSANLGTGFDTLGLALQLYLEVSAAPAERTQISVAGQDHERLSAECSNSLIIQAMQRVFNQAGQSFPTLRLHIQNSIPIGKGMGSSAAAIVAGMMLANAMLANAFTHDDIIQWAAAMEGHADNIAPAIAGGMTTIMLRDHQVYYQKISLPDEIVAVMVVPDYTLPTAKARSVLPEVIHWKDCVRHMQQACYLVASIHNRDYRWLHEAMDDSIVQECRKHLVPGFKQVLQAAAGAGALGAALSGAGPSVLALAIDQPELVGMAMQKAFALNGSSSQVFYLPADNQGAVVSIREN